MGSREDSGSMRLGGPVHAEYDGPDEWIDALDDLGYSTAYCPVDADASEDEIRGYVDTAAGADITVAEVGAWNVNPIADDLGEREEALEYCKRRLELADRMGARCCVSVAGSRGEEWAGPHPENLTDETFYRIVESVQEILDDVDPDQAAYALEPMPWVYPHTIESYRSLVEAIDRDAFGVHFDPVNMLTSPERVYRNGAWMREFVEEFDEEIVAVHLKDVLLADELTVHVDEVRPGAGTLDYHVLLSVLDDLDDDLPVLLEHLDSAEAYEQAGAYVREMAADIGVDL